MPGNIRVAVLEVVDLPATITAGKSVAVKVAVGKKEFQTTPADAEDGRTQPWNSEFLFPVLNLRDNLVVAIMDSNGDVVARAELETPGIVQKGFQDEFIALKAGGRVHMKVSFVLSEEERRKIDSMRIAALKRKKSFNHANKPRQAPVSNVKITEITSEDTVDSEPATKCIVHEEIEEATPTKDVDQKPQEISSPEALEANPKENNDPKPPFTSENKTKPEAEWKPSIALRVEKIDRRREAPGESKKISQKQDENSTPDDLSSSNKPKPQGFQWLSGKLRNDQSKAPEGGHWLEDMKLKNRGDNLKSAKAARADEWIKKLDKNLDTLKEPLVPEENKFRDEGLVMKKHIQEEEKKVKTLGQKPGAKDINPALLHHRTVAQKLEEWKLKESGPWRRSSKVQHASPPDSDQQVQRWSLKAKSSTKKIIAEKPRDFSGNVTIEQPELMAAADRMWASGLYSEDGSSPSMSPENRKKHSGSIKGFVKQVFSGAAALAGSFSLWSRKGSSKAKKKEKERIHMVKEGETLSSIVPDEWDNPESEFYRLNPQIRDVHFIYPGQRLRLRA